MARDRHTVLALLISLVGACVVGTDQDPGCQRDQDCEAGVCRAGACFADPGAQQPPADPRADAAADDAGDAGDDAATDTGSDDASDAADASDADDAS